MQEAFSSGTDDVEDATAPRGLGMHTQSTDLILPLVVQGPQMNGSSSSSLDGSVQTVASGSFRWHIRDWSGLAAKHGDRVTSPEFVVGDKRWRLALYPKGSRSDHVAIYLEFYEGGFLPTGWSCCASFSIAFENHKDPSASVSMDAHHRFNELESDWGFSQFFPIEHLALPFGQSGRPLLEDDSVVVCVQVNIARDDSGTLWTKYPPMYDSKRETGYVGLKNQGATCYMNSLLQSLFCLTAFRKSVYQIPTDADEPTNSVPLALQRVFYQLQVSDQPVGTLELTKSFGWDTFDSFMQHDVQELSRVLQDNLETKMKKTPVEGAIEKLFMGQTIGFIKCINVPYESTRKESFYDIALSIKGKGNLYDCFDDYVKTERLDGNDKYFAEGFGLQAAEKGVIFASLPPILHLQLLRYEYDPMRDCMVKINDRLEFPLELDLNRYIHPDHGDGKQRYRLHGVLVHSGDLNGGHYCAFLRKGRSEQWLKFDDDRVSLAREKEAVDDNYGGEVEGAQHMNPKALRMKRFTNAYMLVYVREGEWDMILSDMTIEDIPRSFAERMENERKLEEERYQERVNQHRFTEVSLVAEESLLSHHFFDLCNLNDPHYPETPHLRLRVLKTASVKSIKEILKREHNMDTTNMTFMPLCRRKNKTVRPDIPIVNDDTTLSMMEMREYGFLMIRRPTQELQDKIVIFFKHYEPYFSQLSYAFSMAVAENDVFSSVIPYIRQKMGLAEDVSLRFYEEIKPSYIMPVKVDASFKANEFSHGDIICFQRETLADGAYPYPTVTSYFQDYIMNRVVVTFRELHTGDGVAPESEPTVLELTRKMKYDDVAKRLACEIGADPARLRLHIAGQDGSPRSAIRRQESTDLTEMLQPNCYISPVDTIYYERLSMTLEDLESKRVVHLTLPDQSLVDVLVPKDCTVNGLAEELRGRLQLDSAESIRVLEVCNSKIVREYVDVNVLPFVGPSTELIVECISPDERNLQEGDRYVNVHHFYRTPAQTHGMPFKLLVRRGQTLADLEGVIQHKAGMSDKDISKCRFAVVLYGRARYIEPNEVLSALDVHDQIGIDHPERSGKGARTVVERAIKIKG